METKKWTVLRKMNGCKISGLFTEEQIKEYTKEGRWSVAQIEEEQK